MDLLINGTVIAFFIVAVAIFIDKFRHYRRGTISIDRRAVEYFLTILFSVAFGTLVSLYIELKLRLTDLIFAANCTGSGEIRNGPIFTECGNSGCELCNVSSQAGQKFVYYSETAGAIVVLLVITFVIMLLLFLNRPEDQEREK